MPIASQQLVGFIAKGDVEQDILKATDRLQLFTILVPELGCFVTPARCQASIPRELDTGGSAAVAIPRLDLTAVEHLQLDSAAEVLESLAVQIDILAPDDTGNVTGDLRREPDRRPAGRAAPRSR